MIVTGLLRVFSAPGSETLSITRGNMTENMNLLTSIFSQQQLINQPGQHVAWVRPVHPQPEVVGETQGRGEADDPEAGDPGVGVGCLLREGVQLRLRQPGGEVFR